MVTVSTSDMIVLGVFADGRALHAYGVYRLLTDSNLSEWSTVSRPQIYTSVRRLSEHEFLEPAADQSPSRGPNKQVFDITEKGRGILKDSLSSQHWIRVQEPDLFLTWLALSRFCAKEIRESQLLGRIDAIRERLRAEAKTVAHLNECDPSQHIALRMIEIVKSRLEAELLVISQPDFLKVRADLGMLTESDDFPAP